MSYDEMELDMIGDQRTAMFVIISDTDDTFNFRCNYPRQIVAKTIGKCGGFRLCHDTGSACYS